MKRERESGRIQQEGRKVQGKENHDRRDGGNKRKMEGEKENRRHE